MTAKEKAKELVDKFIPLFNYWDFYNDCSRESEYILEDAKNHALICVNEIIKEHESLQTIFTSESTIRTNYWQEVKQEIEKLK